MNNKKEKDSNTEIIDFKDSTIDNFTDYFVRTKKVKKVLKQSDLFNNIPSWNFITKSDQTLNFLKRYSHDAISMDEYRGTLKNYDTIQFDKGLVFDRKLMTREASLNSYQLVEASCQYHARLTGDFVLEDNLRFPQGTQGIEIYNNKYKIVWSYTRLKFYFSSDKIMVGSNWLIISSEVRNEILFLLSILNAPINNVILNLQSNLGNEKLLIASIKSIKEFVRIPKITEANHSLKEEIIKRTDEMLNLEDVQLQDLVDFSDITKQKFDSIEVRGNNLILSRNAEQYKVPIRTKKAVVEAVLEENFGEKHLLPREIVLSELKHLMALDKDLQTSLKDYIDDLVFALYFCVPVKKVGIRSADQIKGLCRQNKFYDYIQQEMQADRR